MTRRGQGSGVTHNDGPTAKYDEGPPSLPYLIDIHRSWAEWGPLDGLVAPAPHFDLGNTGAQCCLTTRDAEEVGGNRSVGSHVVILNGENDSHLGVSSKVLEGILRGTKSGVWCQYKMDIRNPS